MPSILEDGTTPAAQVACLLVFRQFQGFLEREREVGLDGLALDPSTQKIRPQEFAERRRVLGEPAGAPQFARQRMAEIGARIRERLLRRKVEIWPSKGCSRIRLR